MTKKILALPGDGVGKEVMSSTLNVLNYLIESYDLDLIFLILIILLLIRIFFKFK